MCPRISSCFPSRENKSEKKIDVTEIDLANVIFGVETERLPFAGMLKITFKSREPYRKGLATLEDNPKGKNKVKIVEKNVLKFIYSVRPSIGREFYPIVAIPDFICSLVT